VVRILLTWLNKGEKCGFVFERGTVLGDVVDRCPECGYSKIEAAGEKAAKARRRR
jgi:predicted Zn-ribbon and HTH transcriptional regulator